MSGGGAASLSQSPAVLWLGVGTVGPLTLGDVLFDHLPLWLGLDADAVHAVAAAQVARLQPVIALADQLLGLLVDFLVLGLVGRVEVPVAAQLPVLGACGTKGERRGQLEINCTGDEMTAQGMKRI